VFGEDNFVSFVTAAKTTGAGSPAIGTNVLASVNDFLVWYCRSKDEIKYRQLYNERIWGEEGASQYYYIESPDAATFRRMTEAEISTKKIPEGWRICAHGDMTSQTGAETTRVEAAFEGKTTRPTKGGWKTNAIGLDRLSKAKRLIFLGNSLRYRRRFEDFNAYPINNYWYEFRTSGFADQKVYVVQTNPGLISRCVLMTTDPGDLVLDPTCGSGTTAYVAEQWGRRWITIDTSRVALALARARIMGARYPYYLLADSPEGRRKEGEVSRSPPKETPTHGDIRQGFVYERVPHITLKSIANDAEIDVIWEKWQETLEPLRARLNAALGRGASFETPASRAPQDEEFLNAFNGPPHAEERPQGASRSTHGAGAAWEEWEIPREAGANWPEAAKTLHAEWWAARIARQKEIDASIAAKGEFEYLYDKPYPDNSRIRVAGPFTVESLSPHRVVPGDADDTLIDELAEPGGRWNDFAQMVLDNLKTSGVQQAHKEDRITFTALTPWPGNLVCAEGRYLEGEHERRAAIFLGPEFGTVARADLVEAAREAADARFDVVIACAFNFDAHSAELERIGRIPILKARMNPDLHMAGELKNTGAGNLFVVFGEPDIAIEPAGDDRIRVRIKGVDVFKPQTGEIESGGPDTIALWFIDTDYNEESFFVRHAYFLGAATDPYKALKTTLRAEIDEEAWASLNSDTSRPFPKPRSGRIAVKVINHLGDEVMKVFLVR
jgi:adenine-specific DNA-methyltransferase